MSTNVTEYVSLAKSHTGAFVMAGAEPSRKTQDIAAGPIPTQSLPFDDATHFIRVHTTDAIRIKVGENPTADAHSTLMPAGATEFFGVQPFHKISIQAE